MGYERIPPMVDQKLLMAKDTTQTNQQATNTEKDTAPPVFGKPFGSGSQ